MGESMGIHFFMGFMGGPSDNVDCDKIHDRDSRADTKSWTCNFMDYYQMK